MRMKEKKKTDIWYFFRLAIQTVPVTLSDAPMTMTFPVMNAQAITGLENIPFTPGLGSRAETKVTFSKSEAIADSY